MSEIRHTDYGSIPITDQLRLEKLLPDDAEELFEVITSNAEHLQERLPGLSYVETPQDAAKYIHTLLGEVDCGEAWHGKITEDGQIVGRASLTLVEYGPSGAEIGYWVAKEAGGRNIASRTAKALTDFGFMTLGLDKIVAKIEPDNLASRQVALRSGFVPEATDDTSYIGRTTDVYVKHSTYR